MTIKKPAHPKPTPSHLRRIARYLIVIIGTLAVFYAVACLRLIHTHPQAHFTKNSIPATLPAVFPKNFLLGTATSSYQVEGGNNLSDWANFEKRPASIKNGDKNGLADDSWNKVPTDINLMKDLGANAYRFSIEWSRVEPTEGHYDEAVLAHYQDELTQLKAAGLTPMLTLLHFTLPGWLANRGGLLAPDFVDRFRDFSQVAVNNFGPSIDLWCTINEPNVMMYNGYINGTWPPGEKSKPHAVSAYTALLRAHSAAAAVIHKSDPTAKIGVAMHLVDFQPKSPLNLIDWYATLSSADAFNWAFYDSIAAGRIQFKALGYPSVNEALPALLGSADFFGMNYYRRDLVAFAPQTTSLIQNTAGPGSKNDLGWEIHPEGLLGLLRQSFKRYKLPIYITENGLADATGQNRAAFLKAHIYAVALALQEKIPVLGYFHWSLIDNFEWAEGYSARFGLYAVDYATEKRSERGGVEQFKSLAKHIVGSK